MRCCQGLLFCLCICKMALKLLHLSLQHWKPSYFPADELQGFMHNVRVTANHATVQGLFVPCWRLGKQQNACTNMSEY